MQFQPQQSMMPQTSQMEYQMNQSQQSHMYSQQRLPHPGSGYPSQQYPPGGPQETAMRHAQMQFMKQQHFQQQRQLQQQQQQQQQQTPQPKIPPQPPIELQMNEPNPNLPVHLSKIPIQFPGPGPSPDTESTVKSEWIEKITRLTPRPLFHPNLLEDLSTKSVGFLCGIGKDVIQELVIRMVSITNILKTPNWKASAFAEVELILSYCKFLIEKIREIRAYVDRKTLTNQKLSTNDFIELMALPTPPKLPTNVEELRNTYAGNEKFLFKVSNAFKKVEWLGENADPRNASLCFKDEISRINAAEEARRQPSASAPKKA
uniref:Uncharacterized protein n=1 Tax=Panagrolaimus superbus TaxID=310955 RepID=A0A914Z2G8_9BILA